MPLQRSGTDEVTMGITGRKKEILKRAGAGLLLAACLVTGVLAGSSLTGQSRAQAAPSYSYKGKTVSIMGDSISTFSGYIPDSYAQNYPADDLQDVSQTWWMQVINAKKMTFLSNSSYSGGLVSGNSLDTSGKYACSFIRIDAVRGADGSDPDVIMIMDGANDMFNNIPLGTYTQGEALPEEGRIKTFADAYAMMLTKLHAQYPNARVICLTCLPVTRWSDEARKQYHADTNDLGLTIADYNAVIKEVAAGFGDQVIDSYQSFNVSQGSQYTYDGVHPNAAGAKKVASYISSKLR